MARGLSIALMLQWCLAFALLANADTAKSCGSGKQEKERFLMLVSTLDGRLTALEVGTGNSEWSVETGSKALLSSSISNYEMVRDGLPVRLIPSLDGALYQYDGASIEPVPLAANLLLSNSFRFSDDSTVVGGEVVETYGVALETGELRYVCSISGCRFFPANSHSDDQKNDDTLVITRRTKTVRTVHMKTGNEKWNFSVGQHEVSFVKSSPPEDAGKFVDRQKTATRGDETEHCSVEVEEDGFFDGFDFRWFTSEEAGTQYSASDLQIKVIVPSGIVVAVLKDNPAQIIWQQSFDSAIASAWLLQGEELKEVNLFDNDNVPALSMGRPDTIPGGEEEEEADQSQALLYVGVYENQVYVQPSFRLMQDVHDATTRAVVTGDTRAIQMPRVHWKPYLATAVSRTPIFIPPKTELAQRRVDDSTIDVGLPAQYPFVSSRERSSRDDTNEGRMQGSILKQPDEGVYLLQDYTPMPLGEDRQIEHQSHHPRYNMSYTAYLSNWWRELLAISVLTVIISVIIHVILLRYFSKKTQDLSRSASQSNEQSDAKTNSNDSMVSSTGSEGSTAELTNYFSRFYTDFEQTALLGKGGFGIVFESKNRLDDCVYAIKRITLNNSERAREKVMREVKALAKLENLGIVRYHQAWFENPPAGWQEERDRSMLDIPSLTPGYSVTELSPTSPPESLAPEGLHTPSLADTAPIRRLSQLYLCNMDKDHKMRDINPLKPFQEESMSFGVRGGEVDDESWASDTDSKVKFAGLKTVGSSEEFVPHSASFEIGMVSDDDDDDDTEIDEGGSFSFSHSPPKGHWGKDDDSFEIEFQGDAGDSIGAEPLKKKNQNLPFGAYSTDNSITNSKDLSVTNSRDISHNADTTASDTMDIVFEDSGCGDRCASEDGNTNPLEPSTTNISSTTSHSTTRSQRSKSFSPLPHISLDSIQENEALPSRPASRHKKSASLDLTTSVAARPVDLPLTSTNNTCEPLQTTTLPVPKLYLYIQMQLCKRESLKDLLAANTLNRDKLLLLDIFHQIASAVDYVHEKGLMHRDLKPSNIFFSMDGLVKIGDFGLVTAQEENCGSPYERQITPMNPKHTGQVGTKLYMSPEQNAGKHYTCKVDIYALGLIFFELFSQFDTQMERIRTMMDAKRHKFPRKFNKMFNHDEIVFVKRMLSHDPSHRPTTKEILAQHMFKAFEEIQKAFLDHRARSGSRLRTISTCSNNSGSGSGSQSSPEVLDGHVRFYLNEH